jgi:hypothetical protein
MTFSDRILHFYKNLEIQDRLPEGVEVINPYHSEEVMHVCKQFYDQYYGDDNGRKMILGINPGRFGAGVTGIPFTDPVRLEEDCGIKNSFKKKPELSSEFIYKLIGKMGGPRNFYAHFYIGAVSPLGFLKYGKNYNYYDSRELSRTLKPFIIKSLIDQFALGINSTKCYVLGQGKNYEYLQLLNLELKLFSEIIPLPHPRWVMQYRRKKLDELLEETIVKLIS